MAQVWSKKQNFGTIFGSPFHNFPFFLVIFRAWNTISEFFGFEKFHFFTFSFYYFLTSQHMRTMIKTCASFLTWFWLETALFYSSSAFVRSFVRSLPWLERLWTVWMEGAMGKCQLADWERSRGKKLRKGFWAACELDRHKKFWILTDVSSTTKNTEMLTEELSHFYKKNIWIFRTIKVGHSQLFSPFSSCRNNTVE